MTRRVLAVSCCAMLLMAVVGYTQEVHRIIVNIPYPFSVAGAELPAGDYVVELIDSEHNSVAVRSRDGKHSARGMIVTVLAAPPGAPEQPRLAFDDVDGKHILAEVWMPRHDGFLIAGYNNDHSHPHSVIKATAPE